MPLLMVYICAFTNIGISNSTFLEFAISSSMLPEAKAKATSTNSNRVHYRHVAQGLTLTWKNGPGSPPIGKGPGDSSGGHAPGRASNRGAFCREL